jgi:hypothetical protein
MTAPRIRTMVIALFIDFQSPLEVLCQPNPVDIPLMKT